MARLVVADEVPTVQRVLAAKVCREPGDPHRSACPRQLSLRLLVEHVADHRSRGGRSSLDPPEQNRMVERTQRLLAFLPGPGPLQRAPLPEGGDMLFDLFVVATDVRGDVV